jgi:hypothetical protein
MKFNEKNYVQQTTVKSKGPMKNKKNKSRRTVEKEGR